ncbi:nicotinate-nucleotide adenylyltransferase [Anaerobacterium chartisolvens]|uniref:Probable nicotinate-nucleotide adenylyltransferase n=1 Tax=Anaerobacterium chartisolvens TaxID=1297424 RepID=A0A369BB77_9FIRM|nr:nicotinate-nucleotide adenylyltransferase [Anaerobacterium chartisolvens]RCX16924.1 nicotinate-nucleotide adenylyltransferase [Anaerobacterium chartisolvens]
MNRYRYIGIAGGTFNPIHYGHLILAENVREIFHLDKVIFIPSGVPPHKNTLEVASARHRLNMVKLAVESNPFFDVSDMEIERAGYTYTVDTLLYLKNLYGEDSRLFFITGADVILDLHTWKDYRRVFTLCEFIATVRPGYEEEKFQNRLDFLKEEYGAAINLVKAPLIEISSTAIRERIVCGKSIKYMVPEAVEGYVVENRLYLEDMQRG